jgi:Rrf2 family protein
MLNLARNYNRGNMTIILKNIAKEEEVSIRYLEQIIIPLKLAKLVKSIRGAGGGYTLAKPPSETKVSEILEVLEGTCCLVDCVEDAKYCNRLPNCAAHELWKEASFLLKDYFDKMTLQDLVKISDKKEKELQKPN